MVSDSDGGSYVMVVLIVMVVVVMRVVVVIQVRARITKAELLIQ